MVDQFDPRMGFQFENHEGPIRGVNTSGETCTEITDYSSYTKIGDMTTGGGLAASFDGTLHQGAGASSRKTSSGYVGIDFGASNAQKICKIVGYSTTDNGFSSFTSTPTLNAYASNSAPSGPTDGTLIGTTGSFTDGNSISKEITSTDQSTSYRYVWLNVDGGDASFCSELRIWNLV